MAIDVLKSSISRAGGIARLNRFQVELPTNIPGIEVRDSREYQILCKTASIPGKGIATHDRTIMTQNEKIGYGYIVQEMPMTFYLLNDYSVRDYFDKWMNSIVNQETFEVNYKTEYQRNVRIHQLREPVEARRRVALNKIYSIELEDAFPISINSIDFSNDPDVIGEVSVNMSYTKWRRI
tara:strand:+ start:4248 stop:4787 length:540 start_codon:yes stop_codon:yes gene_type:complete